MKTAKKFKRLALANDNFSKAEYEKALQNYALVLKDYPNSKAAYNGAILAEMAMSGEAGAEALFDYYEVLRERNADEADVIIGEILETMDGTLEELTDVFSEPIRHELAYEDGIMYDEFMEIVEKEGDFKRVFENIMFSTRVIISDKRDFVHFLELLIEHDYREMALSYLESALAIYPNDKQMRTLIKRLGEGSAVED